MGRSISGLVVMSTHRRTWSLLAALIASGLSCGCTGRFSGGWNQEPIGDDSSLGDASVPGIPGFVSVTRPSPFLMGSPDTEAGRTFGTGSEALHEVTLTHGYFLGVTEVTVEEFESLMGWRATVLPGCGPRCPVAGITWFDALAYTNELSLQRGLPVCYVMTAVTCNVGGAPVGERYLDCSSLQGILAATVSVNTATTIYDCPGFRLPTEAEWEYAARRGSDTRATYNGDLDDQHLLCEQPNEVLDSIAWFCGNSGNFMANVGIKNPNAWGLYDMLGNVMEWVHDVYGPYSADGVDPTGPPIGASGLDHIARGGCAPCMAGEARAAERSSHWPSSRDYFLGLRVARTILP
jgi:formylglycine-generating enzyme required for sulfatase activity